jgi:cytochrome P450
MLVMKRALMVLVMESLQPLTILISGSCYKVSQMLIADTAVEEFLRFDAPLHFFDRTATADTEIGGVAIKQGQKIVSLLGSANRDEDVFADSDRMDLTRDPNPHIGFGAGIHFCLGAPLARLEMSISLPELFKRFPTLELTTTPVRRPTFSLRGYESVMAKVK